MPAAPFVILNPAADAGRAGRLAAWLREAVASVPGARLALTDAAGHAERLAANAADAGHDRIVAVGGDGTVQEVVNGIAGRGRRPAIGIVPVGSGNDLARSLGLPRGRREALAVATGAGTRALDLGLATDAAGRERWFASAGGVGFDAQVAAAVAGRRGWQRGRAGYLLTTLAELRRFENRSVRLVIDGTATDERVLLVAIANGAFYGGGMRIAPDATVDDGALDLCIVGDVSRGTALAQLANLYRGTHVGHPQVRMARGRVIGIEGDPATRVHLDGEPFGTLPLRVELHPGRLAVATGYEGARRTDPAGPVSA